MKTIACALIVCAVTGGCTASYQVENVPAIGSLTGYQAVYVPNVDAKPWLDKNASVRDKPEYEKWRSEINIASAAISTRVKEYMTKYYRLASEPGENTFTVKTELFMFEPDSSIAGVKNTKGRIGVRVVLVDSQTGKELGSAKCYGTITLGAFRNAYQSCGRGVARFIFDHRR